MNEFVIYPAIDLFAGRIVRLEQGKRNRMKQFDLQPDIAAEEWVNQGAEWLHVVNLDGAFGEDSRTNITTLKKIIAAVNGSASVQYGGGLRDLASINHILSLGVSRIVIGTAAIKDPTLVQNALRTFGSRKIVLGVDAKDGLVHASGWEEKAEISPEALIKMYLADGLETIIYTNIQRDGMQNGVDIKATKELALATGVNVIASGGVAHIHDISAVKSAGLSGVIVGKALYERNFSFAEALRC